MTSPAPAVTARAVVVRKVAGCELDAHLYLPAASGRRPAIVLFHGGGFKTGGPGGFRPHCQYLAGRGMVAVDAAYRLFADTSTEVGRRILSPKHIARSMDDCIDDAAAAVAWTRSRRDVSKRRVVVAGGSAGGYLSASVAMLPHLHPSGLPNAVILQNAPTSLRAERLSPAMHVRPGIAPMLIQSGTRDPFRFGNSLFAKAMVAAGNRCDMAEYEGAHTALSTGRAGEPNLNFIASLKEIDAFLVSLGYLHETTDIDERIAALELPPPPKRRRR